MDQNVEQVKVMVVSILSSDTEGEKKGRYTDLKPFADPKSLFCTYVQILGGISFSVLCECGNHGYFSSIFQEIL